jgi:predicted amidohydrolase YtcJ
VLSEDPFEISADGLKEIRVVTTLVGGAVIHTTDPP